MNILKSIGAVVAGFITVVALSIGTDTVLEALGIFPPISEGLFVTWMLVVALVYRSVYTIAGGYVTAKLSPEKPMKHVVVLGLIGTVAGIAGVIAGWNLSQHWYPIAIAASGFLLTWPGGKLHEDRSASKMMSHT